MTPQLPTKVSTSPFFFSWINFVFLDVFHHNKKVCLLKFKEAIFLTARTWQFSDILRLSHRIEMWKPSPMWPSLIFLL